MPRARRRSYSEDLDRWIDVGGSPRASIALDKCSRTHAWLNRRDFVDPEDVRASCTTACATG
jgi:MoxR-like ATPase